jgi:DNA-binding transcriptional MerR regulator
MSTMNDDLTIGEAGDLLGVSRKAIRHYEKIGLIRPRRAENGYRAYGPEDVLRLARIRQLQSLGLSLERIRRVLNEHENDGLWSAVLESLLGELDGQIDVLEARREHIEEILAGEAPDPLDARGVLLPDAPAVQEYLEKHLSPKMWLQEMAVFTALDQVRRADNQASVLAAADLIITLAQSPQVGRAEVIRPGKPVEAIGMPVDDLVERPLFPFTDKAHR